MEVGGNQSLLQRHRMLYRQHRAHYRRLMSVRLALARLQIRHNVPSPLVRRVGYMVDISGIRYHYNQMQMHLQAIRSLQRRRVASRRAVKRRRR